jgi:hypothetical protein
MYKKFDSSSADDGTVYDLAMKVRSKRQADSQFAMLMQRQINRGVPPEIAAKFLRTNLAYYAAYGDHERRERIERLYECEHPVFGAIAVNGAPSTQEAFDLGLNRAARKGPQTLTDLRKTKQ